MYKLNIKKEYKPTHIIRTFVIGLFVAAACWCGFLRITNAEFYLPLWTTTDAGNISITDVTVGMKLKNQIGGHNTVTKVENTEIAGVFYLINDNLLLYENQTIFANGKYIHVSDLKLGDMLMTIKGTEQKVENLEVVLGKHYYYHLTLDGDHAYYLNDILVHNATRTISDAGGNWSDAGTWEEGSKPSTGDAVVAQGDGTSGNLVVNENTAVVGSVDFTNYTGTLSGGTYYIYSSGSITFATGMSVTFTGYLYFSGTATLTANGKTGTINRVYIVTGSNVTLGDDLNLGTGSINILSGSTFNSNDKNITCAYFGDNSSNGAKTVTLGSSVLSVSYVSFGGSGLTLAANTAHVTCTPNNGNATHDFGDSPNWHDVTINANSSYVQTIAGTNTFENLSLIGTDIRTNVFAFAEDQTVTGTLTLSKGGAGIRRIGRSSGLRSWGRRGR